MTTTPQDATKPDIYWNRVTSRRHAFDASLPINRTAKIVSLSDAKDVANRELHENWNALPGVKLCGIGTQLADFDLERLREQEPNIVFASFGQAAEPLAQLLQALPSVRWVHSRNAGIDFMNSTALQDRAARDADFVITNAKGQFSSALAEYVMMACLYFCKKVPRLRSQQARQDWTKFEIDELFGKTMGMIGYGDIAKATAKLAKAFGMKVVAVRRHCSLDNHADPYCDEVHGNDATSLNHVFGQSDYIVCTLPLTPHTEGLIAREQLEHLQPNAVFINLGRGSVVDETALLSILRHGKIRGAALDVFTVEPLPADNPLWQLDNVLISPHTMDHRATARLEATEFFLHENVPRFVRGLDLLNPVDSRAGY